MTPEDMSQWLSQQQSSAKAKAAGVMVEKARRSAELVQQAAARTGRPARLATRVSRTESGAVLQVGYGRGFPGRRVVNAVVAKGGGGD